MKKWIIKYYDLVFGEEGETDEVPYSNKRFMFVFSLVILLAVIIFIVLDIMENIAEL